MMRDMINNCQLDYNNILKCKKRLRRLRLSICVSVLVICGSLFIIRDVPASKIVWQDYILFLAIFIAQCVYTKVRNYLLFKSITIITCEKQAITNSEFTMEQLELIKQIKQSPEPLLPLTHQIISQNVKHDNLVNIVNSNVILIQGIIEFLK